jgi:hypothetical protein
LDKIATLPADHIIRQTTLNQGKKNKDKWAWNISVNIDKADEALVDWYVDTLLALYAAIEQ